MIFRLALVTEVKRHLDMMVNPRPLFYVSSVAHHFTPFTAEESPVVVKAFEPLHFFDANTGVNVFF